jgi:hypothetical protein
VAIFRLLQFLRLQLLARFPSFRCHQPIAMAAHLRRPSVSDEELKIVKKVSGLHTAENASRVRIGSLPLRDLRGDEAVIFTPYLLAGLAFPMSGFFVALLKFYGLRLQHLTPHAVLIVAIFVHLCEGFVGVEPCVRVFRYYYQLRFNARGADVIGGAYFQRRGSLKTPYLKSISSGKWEDWPKRWILVRTGQRLAELELLPTSGLSLGFVQGVNKPPSLEREFKPVLKRIADLSRGGLTSIMVLVNFLQSRLAPLQERGLPARFYRGSNDPQRIERGADGDLDVATITWVMNKLTQDIARSDLTSIPLPCLPLHMQREVLEQLQDTMPKLGYYTLMPSDFGEEALVSSAASSDASEPVRDASVNRGKAPAAESSRGGSSRGKEKVTSPEPLLQRRRAPLRIGNRNPAAGGRKEGGSGSRVRARDHAEDATPVPAPKRAKSTTPVQPRKAGKAGLLDLDPDLHPREAELQRQERARILAALEESARQKQVERERPRSEEAARERPAETSLPATTPDPALEAGDRPMTDLGPESGGESEVPRVPPPHPAGQAAYTALLNLGRKWRACGPRYA